MNTDLPLRWETIEIAGTRTGLYVPDAGDVYASYKKGDISFPFWSQVWPSAIALSDFIVRHHQLVDKRKVMELGAGLGLPSLVAARYASLVICTDKEKAALEVVAASAAALQHHHLETMLLDWSQYHPLHADVFLMSDLNYEPQALPALEHTIQHLLNSGATILLSTPQRVWAREFIQSLLEYTVHREEMAIPHRDENVPVSLFVLRKDLLHNAKFDSKRG